MKKDVRILLVGERECGRGRPGPGAGRGPRLRGRAGAEGALRRHAAGCQSARGCGPGSPIPARAPSPWGRESGPAGLGRSVAAPGWAPAAGPGRDRAGPGADAPRVPLLDPQVMKSACGVGVFRGRPRT